ncbi:MAG TPA: Calx-beta domain-containing protein [Gammaproteobacteria bacterium]
MITKIIGIKPFSIARLAAAFSLTAASCWGTASGAPGGELDPTFGDNGRLNLRFDLGLDLQADGRALAEQPADGKLVIGGYSGPRDSSALAVVRLNPDGSLDEGFGVAGIATIDSSARWARVDDLILQSDGKIVVAGVAEEDSISYFTIVRFDTGGVLDTTFGNGGLAKLDLGDVVGTYVSEIAWSREGKLVLLGTTSNDIVFARFHANGALDTTFGMGRVAGTTIVDTGILDYSASLIRQPDDKWIACGTRGTGFRVDGDGGMLAIRLNADGSLDSGFGTNGVWWLENRPLPSGTGACALLPGGNLVLAGFVGWAADWFGGVPDSPRQPVLFRLRPDGVFDGAFGGPFDLDTYAELHSITLLEDGYLAVAGETYEGVFQSGAMFFSRINAVTGLLDSGFGRDGVTIVDFGEGAMLSRVPSMGVIQLRDGKLMALGSAEFELTVRNLDSFSSMPVSARVDPYGNGNSGFVGFFCRFAVDESAGQVFAEVRRTGGSVGPLIVDYETYADDATSPDDFTAVSGTLTWMDGEMDTKHIAVPITDDQATETGEMFRIRLVNSSTDLTWSDRPVWITDNDPQPSSSNSGVVSGGGPVSGTFGAGNGGGGALGLEMLLLLAAVAARARTRLRP